MTVEPSLFFRRVVLRYIPTIIPFSRGISTKSTKNVYLQLSAVFRREEPTNPYGYCLLHPRHPLLCTYRPETQDEGHGRFESSNTVQVWDQLLEADRIFFNVGGRALVPSIPGLEKVDYFTNSSMMDVDFLPEHLVIIRGSYILRDDRYSWRCTLAVWVSAVSCLTQTLKGYKFPTRKKQIEFCCYRS